MSFSNTRPRADSAAPRRSFKSAQTRSFKKAFALASAALAFVLLSQATETRAQVAVGQTGALKISSRGTAFAVQVELEGTYTVHEHYVEVNVEKVFIYDSPHCPYQGRRVVNTLLLGLAKQAGPGRAWSIENRSLPVVVERVMRPGDDYTLAGLYFQIPRSEGADLAQRWLVVETEELALDLPDEDRDRKGYAFAHSCRCVFTERGETPER